MKIEDSEWFSLVMLNSFSFRQSFLRLSLRWYEGRLALTETSTKQYGIINSRRSFTMLTAWYGDLLLSKESPKNSLVLHWRGRNQRLTYWSQRLVFHRQDIPCSLRRWLRHTWCYPDVRSERWWSGWHLAHSRSQIERRSRTPWHGELTPWTTPALVRGAHITRLITDRVELHMISVGIKCRSLHVGIWIEDIFRESERVGFSLSPQFPVW